MTVIWMMKDWEVTSMMKIWTLIQQMVENPNHDLGCTLLLHAGVRSNHLLANKNALLRLRGSSRDSARRTHDMLPTSDHLSRSGIGCSNDLEVT